MLAEELQLAGLMQPLKLIEEASPEQSRQHAHRQEEPRPAVHPSLAVGREPTAGHDGVHMRVVRQRRAPRPRKALGRLDPETRGDLGFRRSDLVALVQDVGATHADQAVEKSIDLELITSPLPALATVQPEMMTEALSNLIDNAIRYTPRADEC